MPTTPIVIGVVFKLNPKYPGYAFGSDGSIWSCRRVGSKKHEYSNTWRRLKGCVTKRYKSGYVFVAVRSVDDRLRKTRSAHSLILEAFVGPRPTGMEACHNDGDGLNNSIQNLRWDTPASNTNDKLKHGVLAKGESLPHSKLSRRIVLRLRSLPIEKFDATEEAKRYGVSEPTIYRARSNTTWRHVCK